MASSWQGAPYFRGFDRELAQLVSKPAISLIISWGGASVERLCRLHVSCFRHFLFLKFPTKVG